MKKINEIERLRALAVIMVAFAHIELINHFIPAPFFQSWSGVDLFFVISGFVVSKSLFKLLPDFKNNIDIFDRINLSVSAIKQFFLKRALRILPLALVWMALPLLARFFFNTSGAFGDFSKYKAYAEAFSVMTFQYNYALIFNAIPGALGYYWSLSVEEHFYLLLPLLLILFPKDKQRLFMALGISAFIILIVRPFMNLDLPGEGKWMWMRFASHNRFDGLFLGVAMSLVSRHSIKSFKKPKSTILNSMAIFLGLFSIFVVWSNPGAFLNSTFPQALLLTVQTFFSVILVFLASLEQGYILQIPVLSGLLEFIGTRSYAIYLIHGPTERLIVELNTRYNLGLSPLEKLILWIVVLGVLVEVSHRLIEKPFMNFYKRLPSLNSVNSNVLSAKDRFKIK